MARERFTKTLTDRIQALTSALALQCAFARARVHEQERTLAKGSRKKMKDFGYRPVSVQFLGGVEIPLMARYWSRSEAAKQKGKGCYFGLLVIYVVNQKERIEREFAPVIDGTLRGPDEIFHLLASYLSQLGITDAAKILFIADGATWNCTRVAPLLKRLGIEGRCRELVDFYHVIEHVNKLAALKTKWRSSERQRWVGRQRRRLWRGEVQAFQKEVEKFCRGK